MTKGQNVTTDVLCKICKTLSCDFKDIMEYIGNSSYGDGVRCGANFVTNLEGTTNQYQTGNGDGENSRFIWIPVSEIDNFTFFVFERRDDYASALGGVFKYLTFPFKNGFIREMYRKGKSGILF